MQSAFFLLCELDQVLSYEVFKVLRLFYAFYSHDSNVIKEIKVE